MTDFDKLIKEKAENASYACKHSDWRKFQRVSGKGRALRYWLYGAASAVVVGGVVLTAVLVAPKNGTPSDIMPQPVAEVTDSLQIDTLTLAPHGEWLSEPATDSTPAARPSGKTQPSEKTDDVAPNPRRDTTARRVAPVRYGRPLVIDVDTITDNVPTDEELKNGHSRLF